MSSTNFSSKLLLQFFILQKILLLISFSNFSSKKKEMNFSNFSLQHLQFSLISLLLFSFFNFCLAIYLAPPCFTIHASPMQEEMGIGRLSIFKPYSSLLLWGSISRRIGLCVCVCVFWVMFLCKLENFNFFLCCIFFFSPN